MKKPFKIFIALSIAFTMSFFLKDIFFSNSQSRHLLNQAQSTVPVSYAIPTSISTIPPISPSIFHTKLKPTSISLSGLKTQSNKTYRVLTIGYNPVENNQSYADKYFKNAMNDTAINTEQKVWKDTQTSFAKITNDKHKFDIVKSVNITDPYVYPDGFSYNLSTYSQCVFNNPNYNAKKCEERKFQFDYVNWIKKYRICEIAQSVKADEIWMLSLPYIMTWEIFMIGPNYGFNVNGSSYTVDTCKKHYIVVNGTYDRPTNMLHDIGHRVEATMNYLTQNWIDTDRKKFWETFASVDKYNGHSSENITCGNAHYPFNTSTAYDYSNVSIKENNCKDWANFPNLTGITESINCQQWGCDDAGWQEYWLSFIPKNEGNTQMISNTGKKFLFPNDWWSLILSPDFTIVKRQEMQ